MSKESKSEPTPNLHVPTAGGSTNSRARPRWVGGCRGASLKREVGRPCKPFGVRRGAPVWATTCLRPWESGVRRLQSARVSVGARAEVPAPPTT